MQTSISINRAIAVPGLVEGRPNQFVQSRILEGSALAGYGVFRVPVIGTPGTRISEPGQVYQTPSPVAAADVDALIATIASSASAQVITALNGVVGGAVMNPPRQATLVLSSHTDWDATNATLRYVNQDGQTVTELLAIPNAGNATVNSVGYVRQLISLSIPAQTGTGGTATLGVLVLDSSVTLADFEGFAIYDASHTPFSSTYHYGDADAVPCLYKGAIWVTTEDACVAGAGVFVRVSGTGIIGAVRSDVDTAAAVAITNARFVRTSAIGGLNLIELY